MNRDYPRCSADREDDEPPDDAQPTPHRCRHGWTGDPDKPTPCPTCKPHLARRDT